MNRSALYVTLIVLAHFLVNVAHGLAHRELRIGLTPAASIFVLGIILLSPLLAMALVWTKKKQLGLLLLSASMCASLIFGLYHHFLAASPDHVHTQPDNGWGTAFIATAYALLISEAIGTYAGIYFLRRENERRI